MRLALLAATLAAALAAPAWAEDMRDPEDGAFDMSDDLLHRSGLFPVPALITEPAVGYGGGLMLMYFSESLAEAGEPMGVDVAHSKEQNAFYIQVGSAWR
ncbi:hypothetical protein [Bordetella pseudohinzii]|uniref:Uncharacterized protein n=1 Tax=Bordetella pseudohinzii TaxID=1331258 RepID=A0A0J6EYC1_9BORD|nr:hypothetical protein BBN53_09810 [Bordetella pseudohinzii]KMM25345.1 hypothetical protein L540_20975 [Bordetella pseudohinzii]KXA75995.1 hypothetical protein AW878_19000 [Bordetella pseudohinzii]KXA81237.1 hypothetical protein AW877_04725 [Bordetella pseudohinzii]CUJ04377.1 Uncharacterised protein [Bordetella pseudohinzii]